MFGHCPGDSKPFEKQVAMIAQKIVDAKHSEQDRRRPVTAPYPRAFTFWTSWPDHLFILRERFSGSRSAQQSGSNAYLPVLSRARSKSISRPMRSAASERASSFMSSRDR
jgi:hypothetical protein